MSQNNLTLRFPLRSPADAKALSGQPPPLMPAMFKAEDSASTIHYSRFTVLSDKTLLFLGEFAGAVRLNPKSKDPMIGTQNPAESIFVIPQANGAPPIKVTGFSTFVTTKAAAYCFLPSVTAIKFIANLGAGP